MDRNYRNLENSRPFEPVDKTGDRRAGYWPIKKLHYIQVSNYLATALIIMSTSLAAFSQTDDVAFLDEDSIRSLLAYNDRVLQLDVEVAIFIYYDSSDEEIHDKKQALGILGIEVDFEYTRNTFGEIESMRTIHNDGEGMTEGFGKLVVTRRQDGSLNLISTTRSKVR